MLAAAAGGSITALASSGPQARAAPPAATGPAGIRILDSSAAQANLRKIRNADTSGHEDLFGEYNGLSDYARGDYKGAMENFRLGAYYSDKTSQLAIGLLYANGLGVARDPVKACAWMAIAAQRNYPAFVATRDAHCSKLTRVQLRAALAEARKLLPVYGDAAAKPRLASKMALARAAMTGSRIGYNGGVQIRGPIIGGGSAGGEAVDVGIPSGTDMDNSNPFTGYWATSRWNPGQYFESRAAEWAGTATVGPLHPIGAPAAAASSREAPASAASSGH